MSAPGHGLGALGLGGVSGASAGGGGSGGATAGATGASAVPSSSNTGAGGSAGVSNTAANVVVATANAAAQGVVPGPSGVLVGASPKARLGFLLSADNAPNSTGSSSRLPDRSRTLSSDAGVGASASAANVPNVAWSSSSQQQRAHSADSLSSTGGNMGAAEYHGYSAMQTTQLGNSANPSSSHFGFGIGSSEDSFGSDGTHSPSTGSASASGRLHSLDDLPGTWGRSLNLGGNSNSSQQQQQQQPQLVPASHLLQSSAFGGIYPSYAAQLQQQQQHAQQQQQQQHVHVQPTPSTHVFGARTLAPGFNSTATTAGGGGGGGGSISGSSVASSPGTSAIPGASTATRGRSRGPPKTDAEMRERHDQRKMKNRISAAASRDRKKKTLHSLQRQLQESEERNIEAKRVNEILTLQLESARTKLNEQGQQQRTQLPLELRHIVGKEFVTTAELIHFLRENAAVIGRAKAEQQQQQRR